MFLVFFSEFSVSSNFSNNVSCTKFQSSGFKKRELKYILNASLRYKVRCDGQIKYTPSQDYLKIKHKRNFCFNSQHYISIILPIVVYSIKKLINLLIFQAATLLFVHFEPLEVHSQFLLEGNQSWLYCLR